MAISLVQTVAVRTLRRVAPARRRAQGEIDHGVAIVGTVCTDRLRHRC